MTVIEAECIVRHNKKLFNVQEQRSKVIFHNPNQYDVQEITVDGCVITEGLRCDHLILVDEAEVTVFVELKGSDVKHAVEQLEASHKALREHCKTNIFWIISSTRCPLASTEIQILTLRVRRSFKAELKIKNSPVEHTF